MARKKKDTTQTSTVVTETPATIAAAHAPGLAPVEAKFIQAALAQKGFLEAVESLIPNCSEARIDVTIRARGVLKRGAPGDRKGTSRALSKATLALLIRRLGVQREKALEVLTEVLIESAKMDESTEAKLLEEHPEVETAFERLNLFTDTLPRIPTRGSFSTPEIQIERVVPAGTP